MKRFFRVVSLLVIILLINPLPAGFAAPRPQTDPHEQAAALLQTLSPQERVGQLFLVTFSGYEAAYRTQIYELVSEYHVGGVVLRAENDNFKALDQTLATVLSLTRSLQTIEYNTSQQQQTDPVSGIVYRTSFIPLLVAISQEGDGYPYDEIIGDMAHGLTPLPSPMAIGATWQPDLARRVGSVMGKELSDLGINMYLGPSLDVLASPNPNTPGDLGVSSFGGSPDWVGQMGSQFITGLHEGSSGQMAVIAKHFPGYGGSDRNPEEEVATVRATLEQMKTVELLPFYAVTGNALTPEATADGLLISHVRYQGFQGNIRPSTKPISFDSYALSQLMDLAPLASWRDRDGIIVSEDLGSEAVRRYYAAQSKEYIGRYVAAEALLAGNDLLYIGDFTSSGSDDSYTSLVHTLEYFTQRYSEDSLFAQRVDDAALRILTMKYRTYNGTFTLTNTRAPIALPQSIGRDSQVTVDVAHNSATLISPSQTVLQEVLPDPPGRNDTIVFITDNRISRQCSTCPIQSVFGVNPQEAVKAMENTVIRMYSTQAGGQVLPGNLASYTFEDLQELVDVGLGILEIEVDLRNAKWIVFLMLDETDGVPSSQAVSNFLDARSDLIQQKNLIVFGLNAPYYLDSTEISKLTAYYGIYSKSPRFLEVAAQLLFQQFTPSGASPVSIPGAGYNLAQVLLPDPAQDIDLLLDFPQSIEGEATHTPTPSAAPQWKVGDVIPIRTSVILDSNGNPVPDNTIVRFVITRGDTGVSQTIEQPTNQGVARYSVQIESQGITQVRAESHQADTALPLVFSTLLLVEDTQVPPEIPSPTATFTATATPTLTPTPTQTPVVEIETPLPQAGLGDWGLALLLSVIVSGITYWVSTLMGQIRWGLRGGLMALTGGLLAYSYLALGLPGATDLLSTAGTEGVMGVTLLGIGVGWGITWGWKSIDEIRQA